jgi:hypothetical protein
MTKNNPAFSVKDEETLAADRVALVHSINHMSAALDAVRDDVALLQRLQRAEAEALRLTHDLAEAREALANVAAEEAMVKRDKLFATFDGISITVIHGAESSGGVLSASYPITYKRLGYDHGTRQNIWREHVVEGFAALPEEVYAYLVEARPDAIPEGIMALAPGDAAKALDAYFSGMRRGYLRSAAA